MADAVKCLFFRFLRFSGETCGSHVLSAFHHIRRLLHQSKEVIGVPDTESPYTLCSPPHSRRNAAAAPGTCSARIPGFQNVSQMPEVIVIACVTIKYFSCSSRCRYQVEDGGQFGPAPGSGGVFAEGDRLFPHKGPQPLRFGICSEAVATPQRARLSCSHYRRPENRAAYLPSMASCCAGKDGTVLHLGLIP